MSNTTITCDYCNRPAQLISGELIYPHRRDLHASKFWHCAPCGAWVGCHAGTTKPLGRMANAELRTAKMQAHAAFDPLWRGNPNRKRKYAYGWLAEQLGIDREQCHIGMFDVAMCCRVVEVCSKATRLN